MELKKTPRKGGATLEKRGEPGSIQIFALGKFLFCNGDEAIAHVTAEVFYLLALRQRELKEISVDSNAGDLVQDINDGVCIGVRNTAVELIEILSVAFGAPDAGVALEFINSDGLGKLSRQTELEGHKKHITILLISACLGNISDYYSTLLTPTSVMPLSIKVMSKRYLDENIKNKRRKKFKERIVLISLNLKRISYAGK